jgi:hypothetical protein
VDSLGNGPLGNQSSQHCCHCPVGAGTGAVREAGVGRGARGEHGAGREGRGVKEEGQVGGRHSTEGGHPPVQYRVRAAVCRCCIRVVCLLRYPKASSGNSCHGSDRKDHGRP